MGKGSAGCVFHYHRMQRMEVDTNILPSPYRSKAKRVSTSGQIPTIQNDSNNTIHPERQLYRVCLSTGGSHVTIIHAALDLTVQTPLAPSSPRHETRDPFPWPQPPPTSDIWWPSQETLFFRPHCIAPPKWQLVTIERVTVSASGWYASYYNAFLLKKLSILSQI